MRSADFDERQVILELQREGFSRTYAWQDGPNTFYPDRRHDTETAQIILSGEMTLRMNGHEATYGVGERCDVPAGTVHSAKIGPAGCWYLIGERY